MPVTEGEGATALAVPAPACRVDNVVVLLTGEARFVRLVVVMLEPEGWV